MIRAVIVTDTSFYAVIAPLLPHYKHALHLTTQSVGILSAAYYGGILLTAIPSAAVEARIGQRRTIVLAMLLFACAGIGMAFSPDIELLDLSRFVQGMAGSFLWTGAWGWGLDAAPSGERGQMVGMLLSTSVFGSMMGPPLGALAELVGPHLLFSAFGLLCIALAVASSRLPSLPHTATAPASDWRRALRSGPLILGIWLVVMAGVVFSLVSVLGPLRLSREGASAGLIAAVFVCNAVAEIGINRYLGRLIDRRGPLLPIRAGLVLSLVMLCLFALPDGLTPQALLVVATICAATIFWTPSMGLMSAVGEDNGLTQSAVVALSTFVWGWGSLFGSAGGGAIAGHAGDFVAAAVVAVMSGVSLVWVLRARQPTPDGIHASRPEPAPANREP